MMKIRFSRLMFSFVLVCLAAGSSLVNAQQKTSDQVTSSKHACSNSKHGTFTVQCKDRYFLGETPTITLSMNNTGRTLMTVKEFEHQKFFLSVTGLFDKNDGIETKKFNYDGSIYIPPSTERDGVISWYAPAIRPAKYVTLHPGESTTLTFDLSKSFSTELGVSRYKLVFKSQDGHKIVKEFEVYFDHEKTVPLMVKRLESESDSERNWAIAYLFQFNRPVLEAALHALEKTGNEKQREFAKWQLWEIKSGHFNALELELVTQTRYSQSANPTITIAIRNGSKSPEPVKEAQQQKFSFELRKLSRPGEFVQDVKTCTYTPKALQERAQLVSLGPGEATSLSLSLQQCFGAPLEAGDYQLILTSDPEDQIKGQKAERKFEIRGH